MATLESESSPRCPTIKIDTTCKRYCRIVTTTIGAAIDGMQEPLAIYIYIYMRVYYVVVCKSNNSK